MKSFTRVWGMGLALLVGACAAQGDSPWEGEADAVASQPLSAVSLQLERAERMLDRGGDSRAARALIEQALREPAIAPDEQRRGVLALSRAHEASGDTDRAIAVVEQQLAAHADDRNWPAAAFDSRLRALLTGSEESAGPELPNDDVVAPFAHVLARYFPPGPDGAVQARFFAVGGERAESEKVGLLNISGALRAEQRAACPLCDVDVSVSQSVRQGDWLLIARLGSQFDSAATIISYDLQGNRVPARYEAYLPMPVADIEAELQAGHSFVVAAERPGAPPAVLLAAPRTAMLEEVMGALAQMEELPLEPVLLDVPLKLRPAEIQAAVRSQWRPQGRRCYEQMLARVPDAGGRIVMSFEIAADGTVGQVKVTTESASLRDPELLACIETAIGAVRLPATGNRTTVGYPIELTP